MACYGLLKAPTTRRCIAMYRIQEVLGSRQIRPSWQMCRFTLRQLRSTKQSGGTRKALDKQYRHSSHSPQPTTAIYNRRAFCALLPPI